MCKKNNVLLFCGLVFVLFGLVGALMPLSDLDHDGCLESLVSAGVLSPQLPGFSITLLALLIMLPGNHLLALQSFFAPLIPPPISIQ